MVYGLRQVPDSCPQSTVVVTSTSAFTPGSRLPQVITTCNTSLDVIKVSQFQVGALIRLACSNFPRPFLLTSLHSSNILSPATFHLARGSSLFSSLERRARCLPLAVNFLIAPRFSQNSNKTPPTGENLRSTWPFHYESSSTGTLSIPTLLQSISSLCICIFQLKKVLDISILLYWYLF